MNENSITSTVDWSWLPGWRHSHAASEWDSPLPFSPTATHGPTNPWKRQSASCDRVLNVNECWMVKSPQSLISFSSWQPHQICRPEKLFRVVLFVKMSHCALFALFFTCVFFHGGSFSEMPLKTTYFFITNKTVGNSMHRIGSSRGLYMADNWITQSVCGIGYTCFRIGTACKGFKGQKTNHVLKNFGHGARIVSWFENSLGAESTGESVAWIFFIYLLVKIDFKWKMSLSPKMSFKCRGWN